MASTRSPTATDVDAVADRHDVAGHLAARREGQRRLDLVLALHEEAVDEVHAGRPHGHHHLARARLGVGSLLDAELVDGGELGADDGAHGASMARGHRAARARLRRCRGAARATSTTRGSTDYLHLREPSRRDAPRARARHLHGGGSAVARGADRRRRTSPLGARERRQLERVASLLDAACRSTRCRPREIEQVTGVHFHRGVLAVAERPAPSARWRRWWPAPAGCSCSSR